MVIRLRSRRRIRTGLIDGMSRKRHGGSGMRLERPVFSECIVFICPGSDKLPDPVRRNRHVRAVIRKAGGNGRFPDCLRIVAEGIGDFQIQIGVPLIHPAVQVFIRTVDIRINVAVRIDNAAFRFTGIQRCFHLLGQFRLINFISDNLGSNRSSVRCFI